MTKDWNGDERRQSYDIRLQKIEYNQNSLTDIIKYQLETLTTIVHKHDKEFYGKDGITTKIVILEDHKKRQEKHAFAAWAALIGVGIRTAWEVMIKH